MDTHEPKQKILADIVCVELYYKKDFHAGWVKDHRKKGMEPAFHNTYHDIRGTGIFECVCAAAKQIKAHEKKS